MMTPKDLFLQLKAHQQKVINHRLKYGHWFCAILLDERLKDYDKFIYISNN